MNLTQASKYTRIGVILFGVIVLLYYVSVGLLIPMGKVFYKQLFPPKNPPTLAFGKLDPLKMDPKQIINENPTYTLNTRNGALPAFPDRMTVYKFKSAPISYNAGKNASTDAEKLYLTDAELSTDVTGDTYRWVNPMSATNLTININNRHLELNTAIGEELVGTVLLPNSINQAKALGKFNSLLQSIGRYNDGLYSSGTQYIALGKFKGGLIAETTLPGEAQIARVDLFRSINKFPIYGPTYRRGLLHSWIGFPLPGVETRPYNYPILELYYHEIETDSNATYPIIPVADAWKEVSKNKGVISEIVPRGSSSFIAYTPISVSKIFVNSVKLAYYETPEIQKYLQPMYVFEGNYSNSIGEGGNIYIYYPAIEPQYYTNNTPLVLGAATTKE